MITAALVQAWAAHAGLSMSDAKTQLKQMLAAEEAKWIESARLAVKEAETKRLDQYVCAVFAQGLWVRPDAVLRAAKEMMRTVDAYA